MSLPVHFCSISDYRLSSDLPHQGSLVYLSLPKLSRMREYIDLVHDYNMAQLCHFRQKT